MNNILNETATKMMRDTEFIDLPKNVMNYAPAFKTEYDVKFVDACLKDFMQDKMA